MVKEIQRQDPKAAAQFPLVAKSATSMRKWLDASDLRPKTGKTNYDSDVTSKELGKLFLGKKGPLSRIIEALKRPLPEIIEKRPGWPFFYNSKLGCGPRAPEDTRRRPPGTPIGGSCTERFFDRGLKVYEDGNLGVLIPPRVNLIDVWLPNREDNTRGANIRLGNLNTRKLDVTIPDGDGNEQQATIDQDIDIDSDVINHESLIKLRETDNRESKQIFVMDVEPGERLVFWGSGFISDQVKLTVKHVKCDIDERGRLVPRFDNSQNPEQSYQYVPDFDESLWPVQGSIHEPNPDIDNSRMWINDFFIVDWPESASGEGLYKVTLNFKNDKRYYTKINSVNCSNCNIDGDKPDYVTSQPLYFVILPPVHLRKVRLSRQNIDCRDLTNTPPPEECAIRSSANISRFNILPDAPEPLSREDVLLSDNVSDHVFSWSDLPLEDMHNVDSTVYVIPKNGNFQPLDIGYFLGGFNCVDRVIGKVDRAVWGAVLTIAFVAVLVLVSAAVIAVGIILAICTNIAAQAVAMVVCAILGIIWGVVLEGGVAAITAIMAALPGEIGQVAFGSLLFTGGEIAHRMSPVRFHRKLWIDKGIERNTMYPVPLRTEVCLEIADSIIRLKYDSWNNSLGSHYDMVIQLESANI